MHGLRPQRTPVRLEVLNLTRYRMSSHATELVRFRLQDSFLMSAGSVLGLLSVRFARRTVPKVGYELYCKLMSNEAFTIGMSLTFTYR